MMIATSTRLKSSVESFIRSLPPSASPEFFRELEHLKDSCIAGVETRQDALLSILFLNAIGDHYRPGQPASGHLYLEHFEIPQIKLFDLLITKFPFVVSAHAISNGLIAGWIGDSASAVVLDIGIGRGIQMAALVRALSGRKTLKSLTIVGIEPFSDAIGHAKKLIEKAGRDAKIDVKLHIIEGFAEDIEPKQLKELFPSEYGKLIVNGSLSVHHIPSVALRKYFFSQIEVLSPDAMVLTEPHSDHMTNNWKKRTENAWVHYGAIFNTIDSLPITIEEKNGLKMFFGREIKDVAGTPDDKRFERHEPYDHWISYAEDIGMNLAADSDISVSAYPDQIVTISRHDGVVMMNHNGVGVLAVVPVVKT